MRAGSSGCAGSAASGTSRPTPAASRRPSRTPTWPTWTVAIPSRASSSPTGAPGRAEAVERHHRILLSTALRSGRRAGGRGEEVSGSLLLGELDVERGVFRVLRQVELPESPHLAGRRSVRGIALFAGGVAACNTSQVFLWDRELERVLAVHSEPRFGDLHSLAAQDGRLYVAATASDSILGFDPGFTRVFDWWAGHEPELDAWLRDWQRGRFRAGHDFRGDRNPGSRFHLNHVFFDP